MSQVNGGLGHGRALDPVRWLVSGAALERAHEELRHLGLPEALADDVLADAAHRLPAILRTAPAGRDAPNPAARAVVDAARDLLRGEPPPPPLTDADDAEVAVHSPEPAPDTADLAEAPPDDLRRAATALLGHDPIALSAALTVVTVATDPARAATPEPADELLLRALEQAGHPDAHPDRQPTVRVARHAPRARMQTALDDLSATMGRVVGAVRPADDDVVVTPRRRLVELPREARGG